MTFEKNLNIFLFQTFGLKRYTAIVTQGHRDTPTHRLCWIDKLYPVVKGLIFMTLQRKHRDQEVVNLLAHTLKMTKTPEINTTRDICA